MRDDELLAEKVALDAHGLALRNKRTDNVATLPSANTTNNDRCCIGVLIGVVKVESPSLVEHR